MRFLFTSAFDPAAVHSKNILFFVDQAFFWFATANEAISVADGSTYTDDKGRNLSDCLITDN